MSSLALAGAQAQPEDRPTPSRTRSHEPAANSTNDTGDRGKGPQESRRLGGFNQSQETIQGRYVSFRLELEICTIHDYAVYGQALFDQMRLSADDCRLSRQGGKTRIGIEADGSSLRLHDAPNALVSIGLDPNQTLTVSLHEGVEGSGDGRRLDLRLGNLSARLFTSRNANESGLGWDPPTITVHGVDADMIVHPAAGNTVERRAVLDAISKGKVGAQVDVLLGSDGAEVDVLAYDDLEVRGRRSGTDRFDFTVAANLSEGRVVVANFDPGAWDPHRLRVDYADVDADGGRRPVKIVAAQSLDEVLNFTSGGDPLYFVFEDDEGRHVAVAVPEFSVHAFEVVGLPLQIVPLLMYGIVIVGLVFATGGVGVALERRAARRER